MALETTERIERTERAGVPVYWTDAPGPFTAALMFRVGVTDERLTQHGITHLIEHVALSNIGRREYAWNGCVDAATTMFHAQGERDEVLEFLRLVGAALADLPEDRVEIERRVLRAEAERHDPGVVARLLDHRFGATGHGLLNYGELGLRRLGLHDLRAWAAERFTRGNAVVWMTGEPPEDLGLDFRDGDRFPQRPLDPLPYDYPAYVAEGTAGVSLAGLGRRSMALRVAVAAAGERLYDVVRSQRGLAYAPSGGYEALNADVGHVLLGSDCADEHAPVVLEALWRTVRELAADGATEEELERFRRQVRRAQGEDDQERGRLNYRAYCELTGEPVYTDEQVEADLAALDSAAVAAAMDEVLRSAIVLGPSGCPAPDPDLRALTPIEPEPLTAGHTFTAFSRKGKLSRRAKGGASITISDRGVTWRSPEGEPGTLLWESIVAVIRKPSGALVLHQRDGTWLEVPAFGWDAETPFERLREVMPAECEIPVCDQERFDAIRTVADRWLKPTDVTYPLLDQLPGLLGGEEDLIDVIAAWQWRKYGLLVVTDRRVVWLTSNDEDGFDIPLGAITSAYGEHDQLQLYFDGNVAKVSIDPGDAAPLIATEIQASRTEPDR